MMIAAAAAACSLCRGQHRSLNAVSYKSNSQIGAVVSSFKLRVEICRLLAAKWGLHLRLPQARP